MIRPLPKMTDDNGVAPTTRATHSRLAVKLGILCLIGFAALNAGMIWRLHDSIREGYGDFASFYTAAQIVRSGQSARLYDPALQWKIQQQLFTAVKIRLGPLPYIRPPFEALLFLPFAYLTYPAACVVWMGLKIALLLAIPFLLPWPDNELHNDRSIAILPAILISFAFFPVAFDLIQGQDSVLLLLILVLGLRLLLKNAELACGAVLALGMLKFHLVIPLLMIFILRKKFRVALGFVGISAVLLLISLVMVHWAGLLAYPQYLLNLNPGLGMVKPQRMPNVRGMMAVWLGHDPLHPVGKWFLAGIVVFGIFIGSRFWRGEDRRSTLTAFSFAIVVTLLTSYYANIYDLTLLLVPLLLLGKAFLAQEFSGWPRTIFLSSSAILLFTPFLWVLALRVDRFGLMAFVLLALAWSIAVSENAGNMPRGGEAAPTAAARFLSLFLNAISESGLT